jgi:pentatricopeptide repeat protein
MKEAINLLNEMKNDPYVNPDEITYNTIIKGCAISKDLDLGWEMIYEMKKLNLYPNDISYNSLIDIAVRKFNMNKA